MTKVAKVKPSAASFPRKRKLKLEIHLSFFIPQMTVANDVLDTIFFPPCIHRSPLMFNKIIIPFYTKLPLRKPKKIRQKCLMASIGKKETKNSKLMSWWWQLLLDHGNESVESGNESLKLRILSTFFTPTNLFCAACVRPFATLYFLHPREITLSSSFATKALFRTTSLLLDVL